ncbi:uncharacterized protein LOC126774723 [Nymphalis io]|uniref:uncharacterized protein LOC126774723 n=1 Tax=Inachis io TaxID=171585 RepID=UPI0021692581|nr:uncharacterized protein LOC126774723 [Nymphalis io]
MRYIQDMALVILITMLVVQVSTTDGEMALANVTRFASGDIFSLIGTNCGLTRCMEISHGTALPAVGGSECVCQCRRETPAFREDKKICVNHINDCSMATFGRGATKPQIPFVFLPLKGQIIYPSKEIIFTDIDDAICAVTSAQYLSETGWVTLRDLVDNDVPFGLYRDEGSTYLQWRGSSALHSRLEGRLVATHVLCSAQKPAHLAASCATFRVAGVTHNALLDVRSIPFHAGETVTTEPAAQSNGLSVLESLAIGVCVLMLVFVYAAGIIFYINYKQKQRRKKDPEMDLSRTNSTDNASTIDSRLEMGSMRMKSNPLMNLENMRNDYTNDAGLSDVSERTEDTFDSTVNKPKDRNANVVAAIVHSRRKKPSRPTIRATSTPERLTERLQRRSASPEMEKAPHSDLSILHCSIDNNIAEDIPSPEEGEPVLRRKLYFNPVFFETDLLKDPPPAAIEFLIKLREVMSVAKEKMTSKRFIPILSDIPEEELYHTIDLGWDIPCARRGRRYSAISLKRENSRRVLHCGGCPGCDNSGKQKVTGLIRSNSCKTCVSDDYKQKIVQKWLDEVPSPPSTAKRPVKSVAKVSGTPRVIEPKENEVLVNPVEPVPNLISETVKITESIVKEYLKDKYLVNSNEFKDIDVANKNNIENDSKHSSQAIVIITSEKKSPSNHATRRVRKNLPPPPPPPNHVTELLESTKDIVPISPEVKRKMEAVIRELNKCHRVEPIGSPIIEANKLQETAPKLVIPVTAADSHRYGDDNIFFDKKTLDQENVELDSLERKLPKKRRFSLDYGPELNQKKLSGIQKTQISRDRLTRSWRDFKNTSNNTNVAPQTISFESNNKITCNNNNDVFIKSIEPIYNNIEKLGPLTIEVRGSPVENRKNDNDDFDPDTLDRKPKKTIEKNENKKSVEKILLKSGGSFKHKLTAPETEQSKSPPEAAFTRKIGSLRQIYEAKNKGKMNDNPFYERRGSLPYGTQELEAYIRKLEPKHTENQIEPKPPIPPKNKRSSETQSKVTTPRHSPPSDRYRSSEERDRFPPYSRTDNINSRRSGRRSARTRPRRVDLKKLCRTEDSGYLSTDSNESKRRARYLMQLKPKLVNIDTTSKLLNKSNILHIDTDTDELESLCDGRSESGGESVETDSVFFGNFDDSKQILKELGFEDFGTRNKINQIDSGFAGETNIMLSGDSDSEHRSVISIVAGCDGRASSASVTNLDDSQFVKSVECS